jgi:hypothetical protein
LTFDVVSTIISISCERKNMKLYTKRPWSHKERELLRKVYYLSNETELQEYFPDRSYNACVKQAKYLQDRGWVFQRKS